MTENASTTAATPQEPNATQQSPFNILTQYVKDQSFENPNPVDAFLVQQTKQPNISIDISVKPSKIKDSLYEVMLDIKCKCIAEENKTLFIAELSYGALVNLDEKNVPQDAVGPLLMIHTPTFLFPYARSILSDMTREGGFMPLMLHPVDFTTLFQAQQQAEQEQQKAAS